MAVSKISSYSQLSASDNKTNRDYPVLLLTLVVCLNSTTYFFLLEEIMHVVRVTDEMARKSQLAPDENKRKLTAMLGQPAPYFTLKDLNDRSITLSNLNGKVIVINLYFTTCPP